MSLALLLLLTPAAQGEAPAHPWEALAQGQTVTIEEALFILNEEMVTTSMWQERAMRLMRRSPDLSQEVAAQYALRDLVFDLVAQEGFRRLGLDESALEQEVVSRMERLRETQGSRAHFEDWLRGQGFTVVTFRETLKSELIKQVWSSIVLGEQPSPLEGLRNRIEVSPAEIREEFQRDPKRWEQGFELVWEVHQFHDGPAGPGLDRAQAFADALKSGLSTREDSRAAAQSCQTLRGDPATRNLRAEIRDFLLNAQPGDVSHVEPIPGLGGLFAVVVERSPARTIGFEEAQPRIVAELKKRKSDAVIAEAAGALLRSSYSWYPQALAPLMQSLYGADAGSSETEF